MDLQHTGTNPLSPDTDGDGILDGIGNPDLPFVNANQPGTDPNKPDTGQDGMPDLAGIVNGSNPMDRATNPPALITWSSVAGASYRVENSRRRIPYLPEHPPFSLSDSNGGETLRFTVGIPTGRFIEAPNISNSAIATIASPTLHLVPHEELA